MRTDATTTSRGAWVRLAAATVILGVVAWRVGAQPFLDGLARTDPRALSVALVVTALTTACCARRWSLVAAGLGVGVGFGDAYRTCYRAQLLNATLPGGVLGDLHRGYRHGRDAGALARGLRSVVWDRASGQAAQMMMALAAVPLLPGAVRGWALAVLAGVAGTALAVLALPGVRREARAALGGVWPQVLGLSALAASGHVAVLVVAARTAGVDAPIPLLVALALLVLLASALPLSIAGWGPREGAAAWAFGAAGLGAATGVEVAVVFGVMSLVATFPGMLVGAPRSAGSPRVSAATGGTEGGAAWMSGPTSS